MNYYILADQKSGLLKPMVVYGDTVVVSEESCNFSSRVEIAQWVVDTMLKLDPKAGATMTRQKVYNERVIGKPMFWEITLYDLEGNRLAKGQYNGVHQESHLRVLVQEQYGFPLELATEIE